MGTKSDEFGAANPSRQDCAEHDSVGTATTNVASSERGMHHANVEDTGHEETSPAVSAATEWRNQHIVAWLGPAHSEESL